MVRGPPGHRSLPLSDLRALLLSDGIAGHFRCAEGILAAAGRCRPVAVTTIPVARPALAPTDALAWLTNRKVPPALILKHVFGVDPSALPEADVIVSAGGDTLAANIALARCMGRPNLFFGSLRKYRPEDFTLALNSYATDRPAANQVRILKPCPADPSTLPTPDIDHRRLPKVSGLLIGGNSGDGRYSERDWSQLLAFLGEARVRLGMTWIVANSRRTPGAISDRIAAISQTPGSAIEEFIDVRRSGSGTLGGLFASSGAIVVTADSSAMLSEAIWMRRPVIAVRPASLSLPAKEAQYRRWLAESGWCQEIPLSDLTAERYASALRMVVPLAENPQAALARLLADRLPALLAAAAA